MEKIEHWKFGDTKKEADKLSNLVLSGKKTATSSLYDSYKSKQVPIPKKRVKSIITDSKGFPLCMVLNTKVEIKKFKEINTLFAKKEGEGDLSLRFWRKTHKRFFTKRIKRMNKKFSEEILVVCVTFKVLKVFKTNTRS